MVQGKWIFMTFINKIIAYSISILIIIFAYLYLSIDIATISIDKSEKHFDCKLVNNKIKILKNPNGIVKIKSDNEYDLFFGIGYAQANERLWQMDILRRQGLGRLSELFGKKTLTTDKFLRSLHLKHYSKIIYNSLSEKSKFILKAYSDGVNFYIEENSHRLSLEFSALNYKPDDWEPEHSIIIARMMAFELSFSFWYDITFGEIADIYGIEIANDLLTNRQNQKINHNNYSYNIDYSDYISNIKNVYNNLNNFGGAKGSNSWSAYKNKQNKTKGAILANDPHLTLGLPPKWIQMHINAENINALGYSLPGIPMIISGRNENISWGITNMNADICDFYIEKTDSSGKYYYFNDTTKKVKYLKDSIKIKDNDTYYYYKRFIESSPIISDYHIFKDDDRLIKYDSTNNDKLFLDNYVLTYQWTGHNNSDEILSMYNINKSINFDDFSAATKSWGTPPLVFNYADVSGNIGLSPSGKIPVRNKTNPNIPNPGWNDEFKWQGYYSSEIFANIYNPNKGYVYSANNKINNNIFISNYWEPKSRSERINELLENTEQNLIRDSRYIQNDVLSLYAKEIVKIIVPVIKNNLTQLNELEKEAFERLLNWDYLLSADNSASAIYNSFITNIVREMFYDELSERLFRQFCFISSLPTQKVIFDLSKKNPFWFDNKNTEQIETYEDIIIKSFKSAIDELIIKFNTDLINEWIYGKLHTLELEHIFSENEFFAPIVTAQVLELSGNNTTVNNTEYRYSDPYKTIIGSSMRFIADMTKDYVLMIMPGGNNGDPISPNYNDQTMLWKNGGYLKIPFYDETDYELKIEINPK